MNNDYSIDQRKRWKTREVMVGKIGVGGTNPIRIQSMTTSSTRDVEATVHQAIRLADVGCEIVRVTVQGMKEAEACEEIKNSLVQKGYDIPLVADIHFYPPAAMHVVDFVDKIRVNPGNFVDRRASFRLMEYDDATYSAELEKIEEKFAPLVEKCIKLKRAMRIGTNHGSLSDRIMNRYGDTPFGMIESAFEFARICRKYQYHDFLFSMKASNPIVMIQSYRLLAAEMRKMGWDYPLHLGVTEAGEGEDGRIKSSVGIGALLLEGLGDTIRVSLTEDPWHEIDPCKRLIDLARSEEAREIQSHKEQDRNFPPVFVRSIDPPPFLHRDGSVFLTVTDKDLEHPDLFTKMGCKVQLGRPKRDICTPEALIYDGQAQELPLPLRQLKEMGLAILSRKGIPGTQSFIEVTDDWEFLKNKPPDFVLFTPKGSSLHEGRALFQWLKKENLSIPVILHRNYTCQENDFIIRASAELGALLAEKLGDGISLFGPYSLSLRHSLSFNILQACRMRSSKTEFISCPGCGRTLFNLQEVSKIIREKTAHLPGVKIAIMGCIVNGPGEMADADFGYVGSKPGKIDLYVGKVCVERNIDFAEADERLIELIKSHNRWVDPN